VTTLSQTSRSTQTQALTASGRARAGLSRELLEDRACAETLDAALKVHEALGAWHAADTYLNALALEVQSRGLAAHRAASLSVVYRGKVVGSLVADLLVEERVLVLVRADIVLTDAAKIDALRGLAASGVRVGLAFNFGLPELVFARVC
jgi:GxxExxY protein